MDTFLINTKFQVSKISKVFKAKNMKKYEYCATQDENFYSIVEYIAKKSKEGWKLVSHACICFSVNAPSKHYVIMEREIKEEKTISEEQTPNHSFEIPQEFKAFVNTAPATFANEHLATVVNAKKLEMYRSPVDTCEPTESELKQRVFNHGLLNYFTACERLVKLLRKDA